MPAAPRKWDSKATKVAYKIMGVPDNIAYKPSKEELEIRKKLFYDETMRVR